MKSFVLVLMLSGQANTTDHSLTSQTLGPYPSLVSCRKALEVTRQEFKKDKAHKVVNGACVPIQ